MSGGIDGWIDEKEFMLAFWRLANGIGAKTERNVWINESIGW